MQAWKVPSGKLIRNLNVDQSQRAEETNQWVVAQALPDFR